MKGIVLAGGSGTRLFPMTQAVSKQLLPVYDKPMIYYPLSILMLAGLRDILVITTPEDATQFERLLGDGSQWGVRIDYTQQPRPEGLAQAFLLAEDFLAGDSACLILGDNILYGTSLSTLVQSVARRNEGATIFGCYVKDPHRYGVAEFDSSGKVVGLEEKPPHPKSNYAVIGLYFYDAHVVEYAKQLKPSPRGELEITDLNRVYLERGELKLEKLQRGNVWLDMGTPDSLLEAAHFVGAVESRQGLKIACLEEIAWRMGFIDSRKMHALATRYSNTYGEYLKTILAEEPV